LEEIHLHQKMKSKHYILLLLVPLSEMKALFYNSDLRVSWYLFSDNKRYLCNVVEDYSNIIIMATTFYFISYVKIDIMTRKICSFLFIINVLDIVHLGLMDLEYFTALKLLIAYFILQLCNKLKIF
jgi:hypothetical protein